jgi:hypothetical protein
MGTTACTPDNYRSIIPRALLRMASVAAYLLSGCATGSGVYGIPVQGESIVFVLARLLPFCLAAHGKKIRAWLMTSPALYAAGTRASRIVSWNGGENFENSWGSACV